jgi:hypothetical protein
MANNLTNAEERRLLDTSLDSTYLALFTADPTEAGTQTNEVSGGSYARQALTFNAAATDGSNNTTKALSGNVTFPTASAGWGTVTHIGILSASSAGTMRWSAPLAASKTIGSGDTFTLDASVTSFALD